MKIEKRYWYVARRESIDALTASDVMDMLRYDAARVECNPPDGLYLMSKLQSGGYPEPCAARWESFGVRIYVIDIRQQQPDRDDILRVVKAEDIIRPSKGGVR